MEKKAISFKALTKHGDAINEALKQPKSVAKALSEEYLLEADNGEWEEGSITTEVPAYGILEPSIQSVSAPLYRLTRILLVSVLVLSSPLNIRSSYLPPNFRRMAHTSIRSHRFIGDMIIRYLVECQVPQESIGLAFVFWKCRFRD
jgi:hypothetical protein